MLRADHVVFPVRDAAASLSFYADILGLPLVAAHEGADWGGYPWLMMIFGLADGQELVLVALKGAPSSPESALPPDVRHYAFSVGATDALDAWKRRLSAAGVQFWEEDHGDQRSVYFPDPDGVILEITTPPSQAAAHGDPAARDAVRRWIDGAAALTV